MIDPECRRRIFRRLSPNGSLRTAVLAEGPGLRSECHRQTIAGRGPGFRAYNRCRREILIQQALNNSKEQFANSLDLDDSLMNAIMEALDAHNLMSSQALSYEAIRKGLKAILLGPAKLYETLRDASFR